LHPACLLPDELKKVIREELSEYAWHPRNWRPHAAGNIVWEGHAIEAVKGGIFRVHIQASFAMDPKRLYASKTLDFTSVDNAIDYYLEGEFPSGEIDGVTFEQRSSKQS
jgi:hypothetical protein